ncbi:transposase, partial [Anaerobacillus alkalilacustris]
MEKWLKYVEIKRMLEQGYSKAKVAEKFNISRGTLYKYLNMSPDEMSIWLASCKTRRKKLDVFKGMILNWLREFPDVSAAQIFDWIQDRFPEFKVGESSVRSYVRNLRKEYDLPRTKEERQFQAIEDTPMGQQAQVDFGQIKVKTMEGKMVKLYFVAFVLSNSRYKYVEWLNRPFTTKDLIMAHENAFQYFGGIPYEIVYDQDRIIIVSENYGDLIMTKEFEVFRHSHQLKIYMCRAFDPQSKGRIENVVGFVKKNFAKFRIFTNCDSWNEQCLRWLERTGNGKVHNITKKRPVEVFQEEKKHLRPALPLIDATNNNKQKYTNLNSSITRTVRKDNTILFKSNRYSVPLGTYSPFGTVVTLLVEEQTLKIIDQETGEMIGEHEISLEVGK